MFKILFVTIFSLWALLSVIIIGIILIEDSAKGDE